MGKIDGRALADKAFEGLKGKAEALKARGVVPSLRVVMVGDDPGSLSYVAGKERDCKKVGIAFSRLALPKDSSQARVEEAVEECNEDPSVSAFIVQLPLSGQDPVAVLSKIREEKDADGLGPDSALRLEAGRPRTVPCTALAVWSILRSEGIELEGREVCVIGRGLTSGRPIASFLSSKNATVTLAHSRTRDLEKYAKRADIVISCVGKGHFIKPSSLSSGQILVDVGFSVEEGRLLGDFDPACFENASFYTTVPGGVGPMTRAMLLSNVLNLSSLANGQNDLS
ncbi:MAG: bifunctional methylenetetrahydrofolate dehydrogenase/methenyltetrahydrofolate cyclohydrolase [Aeriscardovia sp.]|nr:bifunctional methylenetetrahydrofolate dehydrogenase/methenyltetrahydrofolate cyclohydrolase [Aeriscardovia sp.]